MPKQDGLWSAHCAIRQYAARGGHRFSEELQLDAWDGYGRAAQHNRVVTLPAHPLLPGPLESRMLQAAPRYRQNYRPAAAGQVRRGIPV